jgi:beta-glucanase (GH16 family)
MKSHIILLAFAAASCLGAEKQWKLVWSDEFDKPGRPDPAKWEYETGFVRNYEAQWYQRGNAFCSNGWLVIEGRKESRPNPVYKADAKKDDWRHSRPTIEYTSACVTTQGKAAWTYGRFEVRAKLQAEEGLWPAIWFLGTMRDTGPRSGWPACGEIDLLEYYHESILANVCWMSAKRGNAWNTGKQPIVRFEAKDKEWRNAWHVWRMDWDKDWIRLYIDGEQVNQQSVEACRNPDGFGAPYPFRHEQYLLLNLALGGQAGGSLEKTRFPARFLIDYVRVYQ